MTTRSVEWGQTKMVRPQRLHARRWEARFESIYRIVRKRRDVDPRNVGWVEIAQRSRKDVFLCPPRLHIIFFSTSSWHLALFVLETVHVPRDRATGAFFDERKRKRERARVRVRVGLGVRVSE